MTLPQDARLWSADGVRYERIDAQVLDDGRLRVRLQALGGSVRAAWGEDSAEKVLEIAPRDLASLTLALLAERLGGRRDAFEALRALCETHDIAVRLEDWT